MMRISRIMRFVLVFLISSTSFIHSMQQVNQASYSAFSLSSRRQRKAEMRHQGFNTFLLVDFSSSFIQKMNLENTSSSPDGRATGVVAHWYYDTLEFCWSFIDVDIPVLLLLRIVTIYRLVIKSLRTQGIHVFAKMLFLSKIAALELLFANVEYPSNLLIPSFLPNRFPARTNILQLFRRGDAPPLALREQLSQLVAWHTPTPKKEPFTLPMFDALKRHLDESSVRILPAASNLPF